MFYRSKLNEAEKIEESFRNYHAIKIIQGTHIGLMDSSCINALATVHKPLNCLNLRCLLSVEPV